LDTPLTADLRTDHGSAHHLVVEDDRHQIADVLTRPALEDPTALAFELEVDDGIPELQVPLGLGVLESFTGDQRLGFQQVEIPETLRLARRIRSPAQHRAPPERGSYIRQRHRPI